MTLPSAAVTVSSGPTGAAPCETQGSTSTPSRRRPTAPPRDDLVVDEQRHAAVGPAGAGQAAEDGDARARGARARRGPGRSGRRPGRGGGSPPPRRRGRAARSRDTPAAAASTVSAQNASRAAAVERRRPDGHGGPALDLAPAAEDAARAAADERGRGERRGDRLERRLGRLEVAPRAEHGDRHRRPGRRARPGRRPPPRPRPGVGRGSWRARTRCATAMPVDHTPRGAHRQRRASAGALPAATGPCSRSSAPPAWARPTSRSRVADRLRARGRRPVAVSADALQVYRGLEVLTGVATPAQQRAARAPARLVPARRRALERGRVRRARARRDRRRCSRRGRRRSSSAAPASTCGPRSPTSTCARRRPTSCAPAWRRRSRRAGPGGAARGAWPSVAPWAAARIAPTDRQPRRPRARARRARAARAARGPEPPVDDRHPPPDAARRPDDGPRRRSTPASTRAWTRWSPPAPSTRSAPRTPPARRPPPARRSASRSCSRATSPAMQRRTRNYAKRQLTWMRKLPGVELVDVTGRAPDDVAAEVLGWRARRRVPAAVADALREVAGPGQRLPDRRARRRCPSPLTPARRAARCATATRASARTASSSSGRPTPRGSSRGCGSSTPTARRPSCPATARARPSCTCAARAGPTRASSRSRPPPGEIRPTILSATTCRVDMGRAR